MWIGTTKTKVALVLLAVTALASVVGGVVVFRKGFKAGAAEVQARWDEREKDIAIATTEQLMRARAKEKALERQIDELKEGHRREVNRIRADHRRLVDGLRDRPEARASSGGVPDSPNAGTGCTGAGLARPDGEFLAGYAADAARLRAALSQCQAAYDEVRQSLIR